MAILKNYEILDEEITASRNKLWTCFVSIWEEHVSVTNYNPPTFTPLKISIYQIMHVV